MHTRLAASRAALFVLIVLTATLLACHKAKPPIARPQPPPTTTTAPGTRPPAPPQPIAARTSSSPQSEIDHEITNRLHALGSRARGSRCHAGIGGKQRTSADDGRHPHAAGAGATAPEHARHAQRVDQSSEHSPRGAER